MVKAQAHAGGRGKAGLIKLANSPDEARTHAIARVSREPQADLLLVMLGLADDPVAAERRAAKAKAMLAGHSSAPTRGAR